MLLFRRHLNYHINYELQSGKANVVRPNKKEQSHEFDKLVTIGCCLPLASHTPGSVGHETSEIVRIPTLAFMV